MLFIAYFGLDEIYEALIKKLNNVDVNRKIFGMTSLLLAVKKGHYAVVRQLIAAEVIDIELKDVYGKTPLFYAAQDGQEDVVRLLLEKGACTNSRDNRGRTPLLHAVGKFVLNCVEPAILVLLEKGAEVNVRDKEGWSVLLI
ncbi:ankyrin repeat-containing domain protein, partial [Pyronema domesticum]